MSAPALACRPVPARAAKGYVGHKLNARAERNRNRTDGTYCWRCGEKLDDAKAVWLVLSCGDGLFYATDAEADATGCNQGGFSFGAACAKTQLRCDGAVA